MTTTAKRVNNLEIHNIPVNQLFKADYNPRTISKQQFAGLVESIRTFGFAEPIVVNLVRTGTQSFEHRIVGGHMRVEAAKELGYTQVPCVILELNEVEEKKLNVLLNSQEISGIYDKDKLSEILESFKLDDDYQALRLDKLEPLDLSNAGGGEGGFDTPQSQDTGAGAGDTTMQVVLTYDKQEGADLMELVEALISDLRNDGEEEINTPSDLFKYLVEEQTVAPEPAQ